MKRFRKLVMVCGISGCLLTVGAASGKISFSSARKIFAFSKSPKAATASTLAAPTALQPAQTAPTTKVVPIYLTPYGFEPDELTLQAGQKIFMVRNRTGQPAGTFRIETQQNQVVATLSPPLRGNPQTTQVQLGNGEYTLMDDSGKTVCRISVQP